MIKTVLTLLAVASAGVAFAAFGGVPGDAVATVDGEAITTQEFDRWMTIAAKSTNSAAPIPDAANGYRKCIAAKRKAWRAQVEGRRKVSDARLKKECKSEYEQLRNQVLQLLISFKWIQGEADARNLTVTEEEARKSFAEQKQQSFPKEAEYQKFLRQSGQTQEEVMQRVRFDLLSNKIRDQVVAGKDIVSDQAIADYYAGNKARFAEPEKRDLRIVLTKGRPDAERARAALEAGQSWKAVAKQYSIDDSSKASGGRLPAQAEGTLDRTLNRAVFSASKNKLVGPVKTQFGYYVFTVTRITAARQPSLAEVRKTIKEILVAEAQQEALDAFVQDFTARWREKTECAEGYRITDCRNGPQPTPTPTISP